VPVGTIDASTFICIAGTMMGTSVMDLKPRQPSDHVTCKHCRKDFRAITVLHLRNLHGYDGDHPINEYKRRFRLPFAACAESRKKISVAKEGFWAKRGQHWTRDTLLAEIRRIHRAGRRLRRRRVPVRLYEAGRRLFRTWRAALEHAGLNYEEATGLRRWTQEKVIAAICKLAVQGIPLSASYIEAHRPKLFNAAVNHFPRSWAKALQAAGIDAAAHKTSRGRWDRERAARWVRSQAAKRRSLLARAAPRHLLTFVRRRLRTSWADFVESLGVPYPGIRKRYGWTEPGLLEEIRRWQTAGHQLNYRSVASEYQALIHQARRFFGSWDSARAAAGV
jgi:hypothetical protein